ncbi:MAG: exonuclease domain-containing protein [Bacilli bacterium]
MGFERIRVWRQLFAGASANQVGALNYEQSPQAQAELRSLMNELRQEGLYEKSLGSASYAVVDTETTGFSADEDVLLSVAAVVCSGADFRSGSEFQSFIALDQSRIIPEVVSSLTGITADTLQGAPPLPDVLGEFLRHIGDGILVMHHAGHDLRFLNAALRKLWTVELPGPVLDTGKIAMILHNFKQYPSLDVLLELYGVDRASRHTALGDAWMTAAVWQQQIGLLEERGMGVLGQVWEQLVQLESQHRP